MGRRAGAQPTTAARSASIDHEADADQLLGNGLDREREHAVANGNLAVSPAAYRAWARREHRLG